MLLTTRPPLGAPHALKRGLKRQRVGVVEVQAHHEDGLRLKVVQSRRALLAQEIVLRHTQERQLRRVIQEHKRLADAFVHGGLHG